MLREKESNQKDDKKSKKDVQNGKKGNIIHNVKKIDNSKKEAVKNESSISWCL